MLHFLIQTAMTTASVSVANILEYDVDHVVDSSSIMNPWISWAKESFTPPL